MVQINQSPSTDFTSTTLNGSINDSVTTITVTDASTINTPTYAVIDREDVDGVATPLLREVVYISGKSTNDLTVTRGVDNSTNRAHNSAAKFEPMITVGFWDDFYDAYDLDHNPADGSHDITKVAMLSGATVQTLASKILSSPTIALGSLSTTYISQATVNLLTVPTLANASGASVIGFSLSKVISATRDMTAASGDVAYTGTGFTPTSIDAIAVINTSASLSKGFSDSSKTSECMLCAGTSTTWYFNASLIYIGTTVTTETQIAGVKSYDSNGFTLTWTKTGSPTGTATLLFLCFR